MSDDYQFDPQRGILSPIEFWSDGDITSDTVDLPDGDCRVLLWSGSGTIRFLDLKNREQVLPAIMQPGVIHPIRARRVFSTGTSATGIMAGY
jgi:hypothetical protein